MGIKIFPISPKGLGGKMSHHSKGQLQTLLSAWDVLSLFWLGLGFVFFLRQKSSLLGTWWILNVPWTLEWTCYRPFSCCTPYFSANTQNPWCSTDSTYHIIMTTSSNPFLYYFVILICLVLCVPSVAMAKRHKNYSADEIQMIHQRLHLCFNVAYFAFAALAAKFFKLGPHLHRYKFPLTARYSQCHCTGFLSTFVLSSFFFCFVYFSAVLLFFPLFLTKLQIHLSGVRIPFKNTSVRLTHQKIIFLDRKIISLEYDSTEAYYLKYGRNILNIINIPSPFYTVQ